MALGPGNYDDVVTELRRRFNADGVMLVVVGGDRGYGSSVQMSAEDLLALPIFLEGMAQELRRDIRDPNLASARHEEPRPNRAARRRAPTKKG
jgi:hypothetical protein